MLKSVFIVVGMCGIGLLVWRQLQRQDAAEESATKHDEESPKSASADD